MSLLSSMRQVHPASVTFDRENLAVVLKLARALAQNG
jgi:hypothetical protein